MIVFIFAIIISIIELALLGLKPLQNMGIFGITWSIFIFLFALLSILLIVKEIRIENLKLLLKNEKKTKRRIVNFDFLRKSIGITYVLGLFGMLIKGVFPLYLGILINGFIFAPIGLIVLFISLEKSEVQE